ncbi:hypothetical protein [Micromonospora chersina]|uniref:hypothetical protein n=1 Tax=Micromonospora chersina TaxID=47854 RepID=UPI0033DCE571
MRGSAIAVRAALVCAAAGVGLAAWSAADEPSAHAADRRPAAVERPGGALDRGAVLPHHRATRLPARAAARAHEIVDQVVPTPTIAPSAPAEPEHGDEPEPNTTPSPQPETPEPDEPTPPVTDDRGTHGPGEPPATPDAGVTPPPPPAGGPTCSAIDGMCEVVDQPGEVLPLPEATPTPIEPTPAPTEPVPAPSSPVASPIGEPIVITLPSTGPSPLPGADALPLPAPRPTTLPVTLPVPLAVVIGPVPSSQPVAPPQAHAAPESDAVAELVALCEDDPLDMAGEPQQRTMRDHHQLVHRDRPGRHPCSPVNGEHLVTGPACPAIGPQSGGDNPAAIVPSRAGLPAPLGRLSRLLPRSDLPPGRSTRLDPRPA